MVAWFEVWRLIMRNFVRHPVEIPINITISNNSSFELVDNDSKYTDLDMANISAGGIAFFLNGPIEKGMKLSISMPTIWPAFCASGEVVWCEPIDEQYEIGVRFENTDEAIKARMVAQLSHIEHYKHTVELNEGRELSRDEAASEWIGQYAEEFAQAMGQN